MRNIYTGNEDSEEEKEEKEESEAQKFTHKKSSPSVSVT